MPPSDLGFGVCVVDQHGLPVLLEADRVPVPAPAIRLDNGDRTTGRLGRYVCKAGPGDAMRGKAQLPASSMQLIVAVTVTANGATVASVNGPNGEHGDGLSKAWLWWIGKGVTGWRRTIADAAFANTRSVSKRIGRTARADGEDRQNNMATVGDRLSNPIFNISVVDAVGPGDASLFVLVSQVWVLLVWRRRGVPRTRSPHCSLRAGQWNPSFA